MSKLLEAKDRNTGYDVSRMVSIYRNSVAHARPAPQPEATPRTPPPPPYTKSLSLFDFQN